MMSEAASSIFAAIFPSECRFCSSPLTNVSRLPVCTDCASKIMPLAGLRCPFCAQSLPEGYPNPHGDGRCGECAHEMPVYTRAVSFGAYENELREMVHLLKYKHVRPAADFLGALIAECACELAPQMSDDVMVVPVPLYKRKLRERGFNQAEMLAHATVSRLSKSLKDKKIEFKTSVLFRRRATESQVGMTREQRKTNLRGAFAVPRKDAVKGKEILLIDDVLTTGATVTECARVLRRAGAVKVWVATAARAVKQTTVSASYTQGMEAAAMELATPARWS
jgi:ComF family protein